MKVKVNSVWSHFIYISICLIIIFPIFWMFSTSFKNPTELFTSDIRLIPHEPTLKNYMFVINDMPFLSWLTNSIVTMGGIILARIITSILAAYAFARFEFKGKQGLFYAVIGTMIIPFAITMVPNYIIISSIHLINTPLAVILPYTSSGMGIFFLRQHMKALPQSLFDAAYVDGANSWHVLWKIVVPLVKGPISAITIFLGIEAWNMFIWPMLVLNSTTMHTIPIALQYFQDAETGILWGPLMALASMGSIPV